ncbi:MAG: hypothetical protein ACPGVY_17055 [Mycobacterium sp.]
MSPTERAFVNRLKRRAAAMAPETRRRYLEAYRLIRDLLSATELETALNSGSVDRLVSELLSDEVLDPAVSKLRLRLDQVMLDVARKESDALPRMFSRQTFNILNPRVIAAARSFDGLAIRALLGEVRETVRQEVITGLEEGKNPRAIARRIKGTVGLSSQQAQWVASFEQELLTGDPKALRRMLAKNQLRQADGVIITRAGHASGEGLSKAQLARIQRMIASGKTIPPDQARAMAEAYRRRLMALNVEAHTKTQMLQAQKQGQRLSWEDAIERGVVPRSALKRRWLATGGKAGDGRTRMEHRELHGTVVGFDETFPNGQLIPGEDEYNCRCLARTYVDLKLLRLAA